MLIPFFLHLQVPETLPEEVLGKMGAPPKPDVPVITPQELAEADGILFGFPTRFGMMAAQMKAFFDATGGLWREQSLAGKPAGVFFCTGSQGGGQETTAYVPLHSTHGYMIRALPRPGVQRSWDQHLACYSFHPG